MALSRLEKGCLSNVPLLGQGSGTSAPRRGSKEEWLLL